MVEAPVTEIFLRIVCKDENVVSIFNAHPLTVCEVEKGSTVWSLVSEKLNIPVNQQGLLCKGKALADEHRLSHYSIGPDSKLNLVVKPPTEKVSPEQEQHSLHHPSSHPGSAWHSLPAVLNKQPCRCSESLEQLHKVT
ncbi:ubiquitin-like protein 4A-A [Polyodon spathula]|uniref:ubiquitin-like protein 4A-A n=1 Tax=Polyodon spathula TaxID=7913 RepID=UPI001B7F7755|nr:ubiquitin-like protein 4A-A [Polyodon spathula]